MPPLPKVSWVGFSQAFWAALTILRDLYSWCSLRHESDRIPCWAWANCFSLYLGTNICLKLSWTWLIQGWRCQLSRCNHLLEEFQARCKLESHTFMSALLQVWCERQVQNLQCEHRRPQAEKMWGEYYLIWDLCELFPSCAWNPLLTAAKPLLF